MNLDRLTVATLFEINAPVWNGTAKQRVVGLAKHRLTKHNEVRFSYRRKSDGQLSIPGVFYFDGQTAGQYPTQTVRGTTLVLVPFSRLEPLVRTDRPETPRDNQISIFPERSTT